jgi:hypothetical protein
LLKIGSLRSAPEQHFNARSKHQHRHHELCEITMICPLRNQESLSQKPMTAQTAQESSVEALEILLPHQLRPARTIRPHRSLAAME